MRIFQRFTHTKQSIAAFSERHSLKGKRVLVRTDFNVPLSKTDPTCITDDTRIRAALPTLELLQKAGAKVVISSHLGRPKGNVVDTMRLRPVGKRLSELLQQPVIQSDECVGAKVTERVAALDNGQVLLLENVRFHPEEEKNDTAFAKQLAQTIDVFVNDAFGTAHRAHASTAGVTQFVRHNVAGFLMEKELAYLSKAVDEPERPLTAIIGGAKVSTKLPVLQQLITKCDHILLGGGMIFTFYKALGYSVGNSLVEEDQVNLARSLLETAKDKLVLPTDVVIADKFDAQAQIQTVSVDQIPDGWFGLDIGPETVGQFERTLRASQTIVWNGPMGVFEWKPFAHGTLRMASVLGQCTRRGATTIIGGGDSVAAVTQAGLAHEMSHISTGGGASLELLEGRVLPGVAALDDEDQS